MALVFSLLAALLAILVQQWVRKHMNVFQRYGDPLKSSRLRQYLHEGSEKWHMPTVAEAVPLFLHISLFLFFIGLGNSLLNINTKVALSTIVPIGISGLLYILITFVPIIYPQSPYQNSFSDIFWYLFQKFHCRKFKDRRHGGEKKPVSKNMSHGQMQLAMEESEARRCRDVRAIRWMIGNLTEDAEMEKFLLAIPGSFNTEWGTEVWRMVGEDKNHPSSSWIIRRVLMPIIHLFRKPAPPTPHPNSTTSPIQGENVVYELSTRVAHSLEICKNRRLFANDDGLWRKRTRACIEATASLAFSANAELSLFGDVLPLLGEIGRDQHIRRLSVKETDQLFVMRWTCLSLVAIRPILEENGDVRKWAEETIGWFESADENKDALACVQKIDKTLLQANEILSQLCRTLPEDVTEVEESFRGQISELEQIDLEAERFEDIDLSIFETQKAINFYSHEITSQTPGVLDDLDLGPFPFSYVVEMAHDTRKLQFIRPMQTLKGMCKPATTLYNILEGKGDAHAYKRLLENLKKISSFGWRGDEMQRKLWRLQDLCDGGGLGFTVELFFLALSRLSSTSSSHSALYTGTFKAIVSDWSKHKDSLGTQNLLLDLAISRRMDFAIHYPDYIVDEFLSFLRNIFKGRTGPHINKAREQLKSFVSLSHRNFREEVLSVLTEEQAQSLPMAS